MTLQERSFNSNRKPSVVPFYNQFEVPTSTVEKAECFARRFSFNYTPDLSGLPVQDVLLRTGILQKDMRIIILLVSDIIFKLDPQKAVS